VEAAIVIGAGLCCALVVGLITLAAVAARRRAQRRADGLRSWAQQNGWVVIERPDVGWGARLPGGARRGVSVAVSGVMRGRRVSVGEYATTDTQFTTVTDGAGGTSTSTTSHTHHYTVAVAMLTRPLPDTAIERRGGTSRLARAIAGPGDSATGNAAFDRAYRIRTTSPSSIPAWCSPALLDAHLHGHVPEWSVHGIELLTYRSGRLDPAVIGPQAEQVAYLAALLDPLPPVRTAAR